MGDHAPVINFNGVMLGRAGVMVALEERSERIAGELDRVRFDCDLPHLADTLGQSAGELHQQTVTALDHSGGAASFVVPYLLDTLDALIRDVAMVESSNVPDQGFPTHAQVRALLRLLRSEFPNNTQQAAYVSRGGAGLLDDCLLVRLANGSTGRIDRDGRVST